MRFINQHQIAFLNVVHTLVDGLDASKKNLCADLTLFKASGIDASRCLRPELFEFSKVLLNQLTHMRHDQDALIGVGLEHTFDKGGHDQ